MKCTFKIITLEAVKKVGLSEVYKEVSMKIY